MASEGGVEYINNGCHSMTRYYSTKSSAVQLVSRCRPRESASLDSGLWTLDPACYVHPSSFMCIIITATSHFTCTCFLITSSNVHLASSSGNGMDRVNLAFSHPQANRRVMNFISTSSYAYKPTRSTLPVCTLSALEMPSVHSALADIKPPYLPESWKFHRRQLHSLEAVVLRVQLGANGMNPPFQVAVSAVLMVLPFIPVPSSC